VNDQSKPVDKDGQLIKVGSKVKILSLSGDWYEQLPDDEKSDINSMIGEIFTVEEIDEYGYPWVSKTWKNEDGTECNSHCIALESYEMLLVKK